MAARGDVTQVHFVPGIVLGVPNFVPQGDDRRVHTQLQDGVDLVAGVSLYFLEAVNVPRIQHQRFLANHIATGAQAEAHVRVMQVIGCADRDVVDYVLVVDAAPLVDMPVEALELGKKVSF